MAIAIERLYYEAQVSINEESNDDKRQRKNIDTLKKPLATSTPRRRRYKNTYYK